MHTFVSCSQKLKYLLTHIHISHCVLRGHLLQSGAPCGRVRVKGVVSFIVSFYILHFCMGSKIAEECKKVFLGIVLYCIGKNATRAAYNK